MGKRSDMKNILVTGGAGFIGSQFLRILKKHSTRSDPIKVIVLDKLTYAGNMKGIKGLYHNMFIDDIVSSNVYNILRDEDIDIVTNFAACTHVDRSIKDPEEFIKTDVLGLFNLIKSCKNYWKESNKQGRFISISTDEVYGPCAAGYFTEEASLNPTSQYSASKAAGDLLLQSFIKTYNFPAMIIRPCNNFGARQYPEKLIPMIVYKKLMNDSIPLHGTGIEIREWIYVGDCCNAIYKLMNKGKIGEVYNVGSEWRTTNFSMITDVLKMAGGRFQDIECVSNRPGNDSRYAISSEKTKAVIGKFTDRKLIPRQLEGPVKWFIENPGYFKNVDISANLYKDGEYLR